MCLLLSPVKACGQDSGESCYFCVYVAYQRKRYVIGRVWRTVFVNRDAYRNYADIITKPITLYCMTSGVARILVRGRP